MTNTKTVVGGPTRPTWLPEVRALFAQREHLRSVNAELLAALREALEDADVCEVAGEDWVADASAAIAAAEGGSE